MLRKFPFMWCFLFVKILALNYTYLSPNFCQNGSSDQPFPTIFSKKENYIYVQKVVFLDNLEGIIEKFQFFAKLWQNSNLSPSKPPYVHLGGLTPR